MSHKRMFLLLLPALANVTVCKNIIMGLCFISPHHKKGAIVKNFKPSALEVKTFANKLPVEMYDAMTKAFDLPEIPNEKKGIFIEKFFEDFSQNSCDALLFNPEVRDLFASKRLSVGVRVPASKDEREDMLDMLCMPSALYKLAS